ncbi:hypothetical protein JCM1841_003994 [Sporobolomyces salmonicolor]
MRGLLSVLALARLACAVPSPYTITSTPASVPASLAHDVLTVHVLRADDFLSDETPEHERALIAERLTHVVLEVKFDDEERVLRVNDEKLYLGGLGGEGGDEPSQRVQVRAEALVLGEDNEIDSRAVSADELADFAEQTLPRGLVSTEVSIVEDSTEAFDDVEEGSSLTVKSYSVFVKITKVESLELTRSTTVLVPVLKLELTLRHDPSGRPISFTAFQIGPHPHGALPAVSIEEPDEDFEDSYLDELTYRDDEEGREPEKDHLCPPFPGPAPHDVEKGNGMGESPPAHPHPRPPPGPPRRGRPGPPRRGPSGPPPPGPPSPRRRGPPGPRRGPPPPSFEHERSFPPPPPFGRRPPPPPFEHGPEHERDRSSRSPPPPSEHTPEHAHGFPPPPPFGERSPPPYEHHHEHEHEHGFPPLPPLPSHHRHHDEEGYERPFPPQEREREYERRPHCPHEDQEEEDHRGPWRLERFEEDNEDEFPHHHHETQHRHHHEEEEVYFEDELVEDDLPRSHGRRPGGHHHSHHHPHRKFHHRHAHRPWFFNRLVHLAHSPALALAWTGVELMLFGVVVKVLIGKWTERETGRVRLAESEVDVAEKA